MNENSFLLVLEPYVYIKIKKNGLLMYNTLNGKEIYYKDNYEIAHIVKKMTRIENRRSLEISADRINKNDNIGEFIRNVKRNYMGDLIRIAPGMKKPFQFFPMIKIKTRDLSREKLTAFVGKDVMLNLSEISLFINNSCYLNCSLCDHAFKQFLFCNKNPKQPSRLDISNVLRLLDEARSTSLSTINILGGNILAYDQFDKLVGILANLNIAKSYYLHYMNAYNQVDRLKLIDNELSQLNIIVTFPYDSNILSQTIFQLKKMKVKQNFVIPLTNKNDIYTVQEILQEHGLDRYQLLPCYTGQNLTFFKRYVFLRKKHILEARPSYKEILKRSMLNSFFFGKLTILSNGKIHTNINKPALGRLGNTSLYDIVFEEMTVRKHWGKLRPNVQPCKSCVYDQLCPPISNYEFYIGRNNLCHFDSIRYRAL